MASTINPVCFLLTPARTQSSDRWREIFTSCIEYAGLEVRDYTSTEITHASYLLAFPQGDNELLYQVAFAMGSGLEVLVIADTDDEFNRLDPRPTRIVQIEMDAPNSGSQAELEIKKALTDMVTSNPGRAPTRQRQPVDLKGEWQVATGGPPVVGSADQAEELFQRFIEDGLSQELIRRLLIEAGCPQSWLDFRIQQHFGGW